MEKKNLNIAPSSNPIKSQLNFLFSIFYKII
jgi:hypothetical protein